MAVGTVYAGADMGFVREPHIVREVVYPHPRDRFLVLPVVEDLEELWFFVQHNLVTASARLHGRDPGDWSSPCVGVTELALDADHGDVVLVTAGDRMLGGFGHRFGLGAGRLLRCFRLRPEHYIGAAAQPDGKGGQ